ncbi:MAG: TetR/AcrR family transcriptional regulator [Verrucomicrobia bacterium]|nr:TetR/AcrR family transcriptional regulator [Verrucomicrobiota bacterium]
MKTNAATRQQILRAALKKFAACGYAGTSVQDIVDAAEVTKPTLYYYFPNKAGLYQALLDEAHDERLRLMQTAAARCAALPEKLAEVITALFGFLKGHRDWVRLAFSTAFAAPGEVPPEIRYLDKCMRNFEFMHSLIKQGLAQGVLNRRFASQELTLSIYGLINMYVMGQFFRPDDTLNRRTAERIVALFLEGAAGKRAVRLWKKRKS